MTTRLRRILATVILTITLGVTGGGTAQARSTPPVPAPSYVSTSIPDTPAGRQLGWLLEAKSMPVPVPVLGEHFAAAFLAQVPPDQLDGQLGASAAARFLGVVSMTPTSIDAAIDPGRGQAHLVLFVAVDRDGKIAELRPKFIPLPARAERGLDPVSLPRPTGRFPVGTETVVTVDGTRGGRRLPVQLWYPADRRSVRKSPPSQYAPPMTSAGLAEVLAVPVEDVAAIRTNAAEGPALAKTARRLPVVVFSPGLGVSRFLYSGLAADLASHGWLVAVVDHPGEVQPVEFPDGSVAPPGRVDGEDALGRLLPIRVADVRAVLDMVAQLDAAPASRFHRALDLDRVALGGHSFGGATAAEAMRLDPRFRLGVNLDGSFQGEVAVTGLSRPFLLVGQEGHVQDPSWVSFRMHSAKTTTLEIAGTGHRNFSDMPALFSFRAPDELRQLLKIGPIDPRRSFKVQSVYLRAFLDLHLRGKPTHLLDGPSPRFPEVRFP